MAHAISNRKRRSTCFIEVSSNKKGIPSLGAALANGGAARALNHPKRKEASAHWFNQMVEKGNEGYVALPGLLLMPADFLLRQQQSGAATR
ncbi:hypothetical protein GCM10027511_02960 [Hymenobacter humi]